MEPSVRVLFNVWKKLLDEQCLPGRVHHIFLGIVREAGPDVWVLREVARSPAAAARLRGITLGSTTGGELEGKSDEVQVYILGTTLEK